MGAEVVAAIRRPEADAAFCQQHGAHTVTDYAPWMPSESGKVNIKKCLGQFDVVFDVLGWSFTEPAMRALKPGGRLLV
jgi:NADPH:quinone reductase-like Zn-dependent oxidoreductase